METPRREFLLGSGRLLLLTDVAAGALDAILNGEEVPEKYNAASHWWGFTSASNCSLRCCAARTRPRYLWRWLPMAPL